MGYIGNAMTTSRTKRTEPSLYQRKQWEYCDHCYNVYTKKPMTKQPPKYSRSNCFGPLRFCSACGWRYLVFKAACATAFPEMTVVSLTDHRVLRLAGHKQWIAFVIEEDMGMIMGAWATFDGAVRAEVGEEEQRPLGEQLRVTVGTERNNA